jgi:hypothetical protein
MKKSLVPVIFWALLGVFTLIVSTVFIPLMRERLRGLLYLVMLVTFFLLGLALLFTTVKVKTKGRLRQFLLLTGGSTVGFFVSVLLHNFIYGLFIYLFGAGFWDRIGLKDEPFFFFIALLVCPIGFLIGAVGSIVEFIKGLNR